VRVASTFISCLLLMYAVGVAYADKCVALVIGNSAYQNAPAPKNDARDIAKSLRDSASRPSLRPTFTARG
jgi:hypothetical protein